MNPLMRFLYLSAVFGFQFVFSYSAFGVATLSNNAWQHINKNYDGAITNDAHWGRGHMPVAKEVYHFTGIHTNFTVTFPADYSITNPANFYMNIVDGYSAVVDGSNSYWAISGSEDSTEVHNNDPFQILGGGWGLMGLSLSLAKVYTNHVAELEDFRFEVLGSEDSPRLVIDGGKYNFRNPLGTTVYDNVTTRPILQFGYGKALVSTDVLVCNGANISGWDLGLQASAPTNTVTFDNVEGYFETIRMPNGSIDYHNVLANRSDFILTNGTRVSTGEFLFGHRPNKDVRLRLAGANTLLDVRGSFVGANGSPMSVLEINDGAKLRVGKKWTMCPKGTNYTFIAGGHLIFDCDNPIFGDNASVNLAENPYYQYCRVRATGGSVTYASSNVDFALRIDGNTTIWTSNTTWNLSGVFLGNLVNYGRSSFEMHGGSVSITNLLSIGKGVSSSFILDGGDLTVWKYIQLGSYAGATGELTVASGRLINNFKANETSTATANCMYMSYAANSYGKLNITGGEVALYNLYAAWYGNSEINVSGGRLTIREELRLGNGRTSNDIEDVLNVTGGEVEILKTTTAVKIGQASPSKARLRLNGGVFKSAMGVHGGNAGRASGGKGLAAFEANGGTLVVNSDCTALAFFDEAVIKEGGLTIDTKGHNVVIGQNLTGAGTLTLTGGGKVTFGSGIQCGVAVKVVGGTVVDFCGASPAGLTLGDAVAGKGILAATVGETLAVTGDVTLVDFALSMNGTFEKNVEYAPLITATGSFDESSKAKWADSILNSFINPDITEQFSWTESDGVIRLNVKTTDKVTTRIEVKEGVSNIADRVSWRRTENLEVAVSNGAALAISGPMAKGKLIKIGVGRLELSGDNSDLEGGFDLREGLLSVSSEKALGNGTATESINLGSATFEVEADAGHVKLANAAILSPEPATNATIFKTEGDLTMPLPLGNNAGAVIKRGAGTLEFICDWNGRKKVNWSSGHMPNSNSYDYPNDQKSIEFDDEQGIPPENVVYGLINIVEGELAIRSVKAGSRVEFTPAQTFVGFPTSQRSERSVQPSLVLDNIDAYFGGTHFVLGTSIVGVNDWVVEPKIIVTNGATLGVNTLRLVGGASNNPNLKPLLYVNGSTVNSYYCFEPNQNSTSLISTRGVFVDSALCSPRTELRMSHTMIFTNSIVRHKVDSATPFTTFRIFNNAERYDWRFYAGSKIYLNTIDIGKTVACSRQIKFVFDDSEWVPPEDTSLFSEKFAPESLETTVTGRGLVLSPAADKTWVFDIDLSGEGGFVKRGEGKVIFEGSFAGHRGRNVVEEGVLDLNKSTWVNKSFGGGDGVISNGRIESPKISLDVVDDGESWTAASTPYFSGCTFEGTVKVDLGRTAENPLKLPYRSLVVARYTGNAPNVGAWRLRGTGIRRTGGVFTASDGVVSVEVGQASSLVTIVR